MKREEKKYWRFIGTRTLWYKGGSLGCTIPSKIVKYLKLSDGDELVFMIDTEHGYVLIGKSETFGEARIGDHLIKFGAPLTKEELNELIKK